MRVRLGFSISVHSEIDMLIADEVLGVGDSSFRLKCFTKIGELQFFGDVHKAASLYQKDNNSL